MNILAIFRGEQHAYTKDLAERSKTVENDLDNATRRLLHVAGRVINDGKQDIFTEFSQELERRRHARTPSN